VSEVLHYKVSVFDSVLMTKGQIRRPGLLCLNGNFHAKTTSDLASVTCEACAEATMYFGVPITNPVKVYREKSIKV